LAIIGIIAAITIPSIVANHQKRTLETQFAKAYRTISTAVNLAIADHGGIDTWEWQEQYTSEEMVAFVKKYFLPYMNVVKFCPPETCQECFNHDVFRLNGAPIQITGARPTAVLADGTSVRFNFYDAKPRAISIGFDINGLKKPNTIGKDVHGINLYPSVNKILPNGVMHNSLDKDGNYTFYDIEAVRQSCLNKTVQGWECSALIVADGFKINY